jgi:hypothetical protein
MPDASDACPAFSLPAVERWCLNADHQLYRSTGAVDLFPILAIPQLDGYSHPRNRAH